MKIFAFSLVISMVNVLALACCFFSELAFRFTWTFSDGKSMTLNNAIRAGGEVKQVRCFSG